MREHQEKGNTMIGCSICGADIEEGQTCTVYPRQEAVVIDRHGGTVEVIAPETYTHNDRDYCWTVLTQEEGQ
jgi:hypothetical protein